MPSYHPIYEQNKLFLIHRLCYLEGTYFSKPNLALKLTILQHRPLEDSTEKKSQYTFFPFLE